MKGRLENRHNHSGECHEFWRSNLTAALIMELRKSPKRVAQHWEMRSCGLPFPAKCKRINLKPGSEQELLAHLILSSFLTESLLDPRLQQAQLSMSSSAPLIWVLALPSLKGPISSHCTQPQQERICSLLHVYERTQSVTCDWPLPCWPQWNYVMLAANHLHESIVYILICWQPFLFKKIHIFCMFFPTSIPPRSSLSIQLCGFFFLSFSLKQNNKTKRRNIHTNHKKHQKSK